MDKRGRVDGTGCQTKVDGHQTEWQQTLDETMMNVERNDNGRWTELRETSNEMVMDVKQNCDERQMEWNRTDIIQNGMNNDYNDDGRRLHQQCHCRAIHARELYSDGVQKEKGIFFSSILCFFFLFFFFQNCTRAIHYMTISSKTHKST